MKTQIIYLDPHDDPISTKDKLGWVKAPRAVLVWPNRGRILTRRLDLVLLQRYAQEHNLQLGFVTHDPDVREHAEFLGIPVFDSMQTIPDDGWYRRTSIQARRSLKPPDVREGWPEKPKAQENAHLENRFFRAALAAAAVLAVTLVLGAIAPSAEVTLEPIQQPERGTYALTLDPEIQRPDQSGSIPAKRIQTQITETMRRSTSGHVSIPLAHAQGEVVFTNLTDEPISLGAGTILEATQQGGVQFETLEDVELSGENGAQASVRVRALKPGNAGNVPSSAINALQGPAGLKVTVANPQPITGGSEKTNPAVASEDIEALEEELQQRTRQAALDGMREQLEANEVLHEPSLTIRQVLANTADRRIGEPGETVGLTVEIQFEALTYSSDDAVSAASELLRADLDEGSQLIPDSLQLLSQIALTAEAKGETAVRVVVEQDTFQSIDFERVKRSSRFRPPEEASDWMLETFQLAENPRILLHPSWLPRLPWLAMRIYVGYAWEK